MKDEYELMMSQFSAKKNPKPVGVSAPSASPGHSSRSSKSSVSDQSDGDSDDDVLKPTIKSKVDYSSDSSSASESGMNDIAIELEVTCITNLNVLT